MAFHLSVVCEENFDRRDRGNIILEGLRREVGMQGFIVDINFTRCLMEGQG